MIGYLTLSFVSSKNRVGYSKKLDALSPRVIYSIGILVLRGSVNVKQLMHPVSPVSLRV